MDVYKPLRGWSEPASIPQIVAHIQKWLEEHPYIDPATVAEIVKEALEHNPDVINGDIIPIDESGTPTIKGYIDSNTDILTLAINAKADADNVYTKPEINYQMEQKADSNNVYTKSESNALLNEKADKAATYTKTETDTLLSDKAEKSTTYTKTETDNLLADKADKSNTYTKTETNNLLSDKADKATTYTKNETDDLIDQVDNKVDLIGSYQATNEGSTTVQSGGTTDTVLASLNLSIGYYLLIGNVRFENNTVGTRMISISNTTAMAVSAFASASPVSDGSTAMQIVRYFQATANQQINIIARQTSGSPLNATHRLFAIRLA